MEITSRQINIPRMTEEGRLCRACGIRKPVEHFGRNVYESEGFRTKCKPCMKLIVDKWRIANIERLRMQSRKSAATWKAKNRDYAIKNNWKFHLKKKYGLTEKLLQEKYEGQNRACAICKRAIVIRGGRLNPQAMHIDHCHQTGKVRGLLCKNCNVSLGNLDDDPARFRSAAAYLERHSNGG